MNGLSQIQMMGISAAFSVVFFILIYFAYRLFKVELKGDWGLIAVAAFPFLVYALVNILSTDVLKKEIGLSVGVVNVQLIKDPNTTERLELNFNREVEPETSSSTKGTSTEVEDIIAEARRKRLSTLLVDAAKYKKIDLSLVDRYASKCSYLFKHVIFVKGHKFLGYAKPQDIDWYINKSKKFDKSRDFYTHLIKMEVQTDVIYTTTSEREALRIMEKRGIETIAVLDSKTGDYKGLVTRQQIAESMLDQFFKQIGKIKTSVSKPAEDEYVSSLKAIQREIQQLNTMQSQQLGLLQGSVRQTLERPEREIEDLEPERDQMSNQFEPALQ